MKIAYLANVRFPSERAHSIQIVNMCQAFSENGVEVDLFVNKRVVKSKYEIDNYFSLNTKFRIINIPPKFFFPAIRLTFYISELFFTLSYLLKVKSIEYDIIYSRHEWIIFFLSFFVSKEKLVWESHEAKYNLPAKFLFKRRIRCVCISEGIQDLYFKRGVSKSQVAVAHDAVDESFFGPLLSKNEVRKKLGLSADDFIVMYIGGFDKWKGVHTFFEASEYDTDVKFVAVGGKSEEVESLKAKYPKVNFLGPLPYKDLPNNQRAADVLVVPNTAKNALSSKYTSPLKLFAHMASGIPTVVSDIDSLKVILGEQAVVFEPDNPRHLSTVISEVLVNYQQHKSVARKVYEKSLEYTWRKRALKIINFIT